MKTGWESVTLKDLCVVDWGNTKLTKSAYVADGKFLAVSAAGCDGRIGHKEHLKHTPVLSAIGAQCGRMFFPEEDFTAIKNTISLTPKEGLCNNKFLYYLLTFIDLPQRGAGQPFISKGDIEKFNVNVPSLPEQQRIVTILDEAFAGIATATANAEKNLANARELFESYLQSAFVRKSDDWSMRKLGDSTFFKIIDGDRGTNYPNKNDFSEDGFCLFLNTKNVRPDGFNFDAKMFITEKKDTLLRSGKLQRGDVILTTRGTIGNVAVFDENVDFENIRINSGMLIFRPNSARILSSYLFEVFRSDIMRNQMARHVSGAAQPQLPIKTLIDFEIPVPNTLESQAEIVASVRRINEETLQLEAIYQQKLNALEELKKSILNQAFSGQLN
jgi:type I restriction enzyme S subunit